MLGISSSEQESEDSDSDFVEIDPTGRYGRYGEVLGKGAFKTVYRAFDELEGIEVAWNQVKVADPSRNAVDLERLYSEVHLLKTLNHKNIIKFYYSWVDTKRQNINFITEVFTSGTLRQYRKRHKHVDLRALKNWSRQILRGLLYMHSHDPPVIHRDMKCDNLFVNGNQGEVKIGDLGLAAILRQARSAHSVIGTPEFMAPELYEEEYNELVDIYAFGMCLLELVTFEYPYVECTNAAQIYKKVTSGIKPASLEKVRDPRVREFIEKCIANASERLPARDLLMDPFLQSIEENGGMGHSLQPSHNRSDDSVNQFDIRTSALSAKDGLPGASRDFMLKGQRKDIYTIFLKLRIVDSTGHVRNIHFPFDIEVDTAISVASEMVEELDLTDQDVTTVAEMIDSEIQAHIPEWVSGEASGNNFGSNTSISDICDSEARDELSPLPNDPCFSSSSLVLERLPSGRKYWSDSPKGFGEDPPLRSTMSNLPSQVNSGATSGFFTEDNEDSPGKHKSGDYSDSVASPNERKDSSALTPLRENNMEIDGPSVSRWDESLHVEVGGEKKEGSVFVDSQLFNNQNEDIVGLHASNGSLILGKNSKTLFNDVSEDVRIIVDKLEHLLVEQQKERDKLKRKHEMAIEDLLKGLPQETCHKIFSMFHLKVPDYKTCSKVHWSSGRFTGSDTSLNMEALSSQMSSSYVDIITNTLTQCKRIADMPQSSNSVCVHGNLGKQDSMSRNRVRGSIFGGRSNLSKESTTSSDTGIAIILGDNAA